MIADWLDVSVPLFSVLLLDSLELVPMPDARIRAAMAHVPAGTVSVDAICRHLIGTPVCVGPSSGPLK